jgi:hypothetical protein
VICTISGAHEGRSLISGPSFPEGEPTKSCTLVRRARRGVLDEEGNPVVKKHESLWKKKAREEEEKKAAEEGATAAGDAIDAARERSTRGTLSLGACPDPARVQRHGVPGRPDESGNTQGDDTAAR